MTIDATFTVDRDEFPLSTVFEQLPDSTIELDRIVPTSAAVVPYFWIFAEDTGDLTNNLKEEVGIESVQIIDELEEQMFIRVEWNLNHESVLTALINTDVTLLSGRGDSEGRTFEVRASKQHPSQRSRPTVKRTGFRRNSSSCTRSRRSSPTESTI